MNPKQPGSVFILNVKDFDKRSDLKIREGSEKDVDCLKALFRGLNFEVVIPKDEESGKIKTSFTHDEILSALEEYSKGIRASEVSMSVVVVMSHGMRDGKILDSDGKYVKVEEIVEKFTSENCRALDRKPKLFLFQACR